MFIGKHLWAMTKMEDFKGTTIDLDRSCYDNQGRKLLTGKQVQTLLQIRSRATWCKYKAAVGLQNRGVFNEADVIELLKPRLFLDTRERKYTYESFRLYYKQPALLDVLWKQRGINFEHQCEKVRAAIAVSPGWRIGA
jgi:hypothetical protein